jgi:pimeloyl-ACP methyl ester carboxylesterase
MAMLAANAVGRLAFRLGYRIAPRYAVRLAAWRIVTAPRRLSRRSYWIRPSDLPPSELTTLLCGRTSLSVEAWGLGPQVLLVHGWGFNRTTLSPFVEPLVSRNFRVIAFDMPAHGQSSGTQTSPLEMSEAIAFVAEHFGPVYAIVAHSIGACAAIMAMARGLIAAKSVLIAAPAEPGTYYIRLSKIFGLPERFGDELKREVEHFTNVKSEDLNIVPRSRLIDSDVLIISSESDNVVPAEDARFNAEAFPSAQVRFVDRVGHLRILFDSTVVRETVDFICADRTP